MTDSPTPKSHRPVTEPRHQHPTKTTRATVTRTGAVWVTTGSALVFLVLLIIFILQNQESIHVQWFGMTETAPLGMALTIAAVGGGIVVAIAGIARIIHLQRENHRTRRNR